METILCRQAKVNETINLASPFCFSYHYPMTEIKAFRGLSYNQTKINLDNATTRPYDLITPQMQQEYLKKSDFNFVRLDFGPIYASDNNNENRYTRASDDFSNWQQENILIKEDVPSIYVYRQTFKWAGKEQVISGIICLVKAVDFGQGILPHEKTFSAPKEDRKLLLEACRANFSPIYAIYSDDSASVKDILVETTSQAPPLFTTKDEDGTAHQIWRLTDESKINSIVRALKSKTLVIADGHHRYETSLSYAKAMRTTDMSNKDSDFVMMFLADAVNENLIVLPTHRIVKMDDLSAPVVLNRLKNIFEISATETFDALSDAPHESKWALFGLYVDNKRYLLKAHKDELASLVDSPNSIQWKCLDTTLLQEIVLSPILGIGSHDPRLSFTQDTNEAIRRIDADEASLAFILRPTPINQIAAVAETGEKMPQKSTYFYPKPRSGLVIYKMD